MDQAASRFWRKYATFSGRAGRSEFWFAYLVAILPLFLGNVVLPLPLQLLPEAAYRIALLVLLLATTGYAVALIVPLLAVTWRRLHDVNSSGGLLFFALIPVIGPIMLLINLAGASDPDGARFDVARAPAASRPAAEADPLMPAQP
ncbi:DUF805 domain-containing protein [Leifsonia sp. NPDC058230]|uniref:DUF805 domain-containing protein n=1 Tax=Leifsonia sp. NPDC058230 TaxID=3346391 RepID=UPI0036DBC315